MKRNPKILFHGNCQSMAFAAGLSGATGFDIMATPGVWEISPDKIHKVRSFVREADLVISMPVQEREKWDGLSTKQLMEISSCPFVIHPNAYFEGYFPTFGVCYSESGAHIPIHAMGNPTSDYLCYLCYALFKLGVDTVECHKALEADCTIQSIQEYYRKSLKTLALREDSCAVEYNAEKRSVFVPISDLLEDAMETSRSFDSMNHPSGPFLAILLRRILRRANDEFGLDLPWIGDLLSVIGDMSIISPVLPIYPFVARSLNHEAGARSGLSYTNRPESFSQREIVNKAYTFFEGLNEADRIVIEKNPKFEVALEIANALEKKSSPY